MPKAFSLTYGLDLDTEAASFWTWLHDIRDAMDGTGDAGQPVKVLVESQREESDRFVGAAPYPAAAKQMLTLALAVIGFHYASRQKLLNGSRSTGYCRHRISRDRRCLTQSRSLPSRGPNRPAETGQLEASVEV